MCNDEAEQGGNRALERASEDGQLEVHPVQLPTVDDWVEAGFAVLPYGAAFKAILGPSLKTADRRLAEEMPRIRMEWLLESVGSMQDQLKQLMEALPEPDRPRPADFVAFIEAADRVSRKTADSKKRRLLRNALVNAWNPELYEDGLSLRLLSLLEALEYGDICVLREMEMKPLQISWEESVYTWETWKLTLQAHHVDELVKAGLADRNRRQAEQRNNVILPRVKITALGTRMLRLLREVPMTEDEFEEDAETTT